MSAGPKPSYQVNASKLTASAAISALIAASGKRWVCWRYELRENGRWTKPPLKPNGTFADSTKPATWSSYEDCIAAVNGEICGIGIALSAADDLIGIDIDACLDEFLEITDPEADDLVAKLDSYTETSPSGRGLRVLARGHLIGLPAGKAGFKVQVGETAVEVYSAGRYVTLTGDLYPNAPDVIADAQPMLDWLCELRARQSGSNGATQPEPEPEPEFETPEERLRAFLASNPKIAALWDESAKPKGPDQSRSSIMLAIAGALARHLRWTRTTLEWALELWCRERGHHDKLGREVERTVARALDDLAAEQKANSSTATPGGNQWPEPLDIIGAPELVGWPTLTEECLPEPLYRYAMVEAERLNVDPCPLAAHIIAACATACSDAWRIQPKLHDPTWTQQARIWTCVVKEVGARGTDMIRAAFWPIRKREDELHAAWRREMDAWEDRQRSRKKGDKTVDREPVCERITTQDATIEAAGQILSEGDENAKLTMLCDELVGFLGSFGRYDNKGSSGRGKWLESYDGGPTRLDRIIRGRVYIPNWSIIVAGNIQPRRLSGMAADLIDDGLFQRFMTVHTKPSDIGLADDRPLNADAGHEYFNLLHVLSGLMPPTGIDGRLAPVCFDADARSVRERFKPLIERLAVDTTMPIVIRETAPKWSGLLARLALIFHLVELAETIKLGQPTWDRCVATGPTVLRAATFIRRVVLPNLSRLGFETMPETGAPDVHARWIAGHVLAHRLDRILGRDIGRAYRPLRGKVEDTALAMAVLIDAGWASPVAGRHDSPRWAVNPAVHTVFARAAAAEKARRERVMAVLKHKVSDL